MYLQASLSKVQKWTSLALVNLKKKCISASSMNVCYLLIQPAGCSFCGPVSTDRPEMDAHWSFVGEKERETPANASPPFNIFCFSLFHHLPLSFQSFCRCDLWQQAVIGEVVTVGQTCIKGGEEKEGMEREAWRDTGHIAG